MATNPRLQPDPEHGTGGATAPDRPDSGRPLAPAPDTTAPVRHDGRRLGRPEGQTNLADGILDAAEIVFAEHGYAGATLRQVADRLDVNSAMIAYYYKNKENLFRRVFLRRGLEISRRRMERLAEVESRGGYVAKDLVRAFIEPAAELWAEPQGRAFLRLHARLHMEPESLSFELRREVHNETTRAYAEAFARVMPNVPMQVIYQRLSLLIGAYLYAFSGTSRLDELVGDECGDPMEGLLETAVAFSGAGMNSI